MEKKVLGDLSERLTSFLRDQLNNDHVLLNSNFVKEETVKKAYTNAEVFEEMVQKNPQLQRLKDELGLDADF